MGCPGVYYKMCLQYLASSLLFMEDMEVAGELVEKLFEEESEAVLEEFILSKKKEIDEKEFYFEAGWAGQFMIENVLYKNDTNDELNAVISGVSMFRDFLGLQDNKENK